MDRRIDPDRAFMALEKAAEEWVEAQYQADALERHGEILLAQLMIEAKEEGIPATLCKEAARTRKEWNIHVQGLLEAQKIKNRTRLRYENERTLAEMRRSYEATARQLQK